MDKDKFKVGDIINVSIKDPQETRVHASSFEGVVIAIQGAKGNKTFCVRKVASDKVVVERIFALESPIIEKIKLLKPGKVRRAKLYYLRNKKNR